MTISTVSLVLKQNVHLKLLSEEEIINSIIKSEQEYREGKVLRGKTKTILLGLK
jgi:hypothetical protein